MNTNHTRARSSPELGDSLPSPEQYDDSALEGVAVNVKLLLKLIHDHKDACKKGQNDSRRMLRVAGMMTLLDNVRNRIQKCQSFGNKRPLAKLTRCNTDIRTNPPHDKRAGEGIVDDDKAKLKKDLNACLVARKSFEVMCSSIGKEKEFMAAELARKNYELSELEEHVKVMCSSIGKEKEFMAAELARKNYELSELEEHVNDLRPQNETLLEKVKEFAANHEDKFGKGKGKVEGNAADLQVRNKAVSEQLQRSLDGYRLMKRKLRNTHEEALVMRETMEKMSEKVGAGLQHVHAMKQQIETKSDDDKLVCFKEGTSEVEHFLECLEMMASKHVQRKQ